MAKSKKKSWIKSENELPSNDRMVRVKTIHGDEVFARFFVSDGTLWIVENFIKYLSLQEVTHWRERD